MEGVPGVLHPPGKFGMVADGVFRCSVPSKAVHFPFLGSLRLKTAILLTPEKPLKEVTEWFRESNIEMIHLGSAWGSHAHSGWKPVADDVVKQALETALDPACQPVVLMCPSGVSQTALLVGCLRRCQGWDIVACLHEYRMFAGLNAREMCEQYIELFDTDLVNVSFESATEND